MAEVTQVGTATPENGKTKWDASKAAIKSELRKKVDPLYTDLVDYFVDGDKKGTKVRDPGYSKLVDRMLEAGCSAEQVAQAILDLERQVRILRDDCGFKELSIETAEIRKWLIGTVEDQIKDGLINFKSEKSITKMVKIGRENFGKLLGIRGLGIITKKAFDVIFGDKSGDYEFAKDSLSLEAFTAEIKGRVLPFAATKSSDAVYKMLLLFRSKEFIILPPEDMGGAVQETLISEWQARIPKPLEPTKPTEPTIPTKPTDPTKLKEYDEQLKEYKKQKKEYDTQVAEYPEKLEKHKTKLKAYEALPKLIEKYIKEGDFEKLPEELVKYDKDIFKNKNIIDLYQSTLYQRAKQAVEYMQKQKVQNGGDGKLTPDEVQNAYCYAGLATFDADYGSIKSELIAIGGNAKDLYKIETSNEYVTKALIKSITLFGIYGPENKEHEALGSPVYENYKAHIKWLKKAKAVDEAMRAKEPQATSPVDEQVLKDSKDEGVPNVPDKTPKVTKTKVSKNK